MKLKDKIRETDGKFSASMIAVVVLGVMLLLGGDMFFGVKEDKKTENDVEEVLEKNDYLSELETKTRKILSQVSGAGKVDIMITLNSGSETVFAQENKKSTSETEENAPEGDSRGIVSETEENSVVTIDNGDGSTSPVVIKELTAEIAGIVIVAEGGDNIIVKDSLIRAAQALFNVPANKVEVFKMK